MTIKQKLISKFGMLISFAVASTNLLTTPNLYAQDVDDIRWKSENQVRDLYGEPNTVHGPVGTHASYSLWKYDDYTVAFANNRAFHLFKKDSLTKLQLEEER